jgi:cell division protein ZapA
MIHLDVTIMGQPYRLVCKEDEERALREAAAFLDKKMTVIRDAGKIKGNDRIAVMAALGMAAEFLSVKAPQGPLSDMSILEVQTKISAMHKVLDSGADAARNPVLIRENSFLCGGQESKLRFTLRCSRLPYIP